jgi:hypothetical protein
VDPDSAVVALADEGTVEGAGMYLESNIIVDAEKLVRFQTASLVTFTNNFIPLPWSGPGGGNSNQDPRLKYIPQLAETTDFTTWEQAQVFRKWFSLLPGSPAHGRGGVVPLGASITGEPFALTSDTTATLRVGINASGSGIPVTGFPNGSGYTHYKWRLDGGPWSAETPIATLISLTGLANGSHTLYVSGKRDSGFYQDDPVFGTDAVITASRTWTVDTSYAGTLVLNEVLARNTSAVPIADEFPDLIELYNGAVGEVDLSGMGLTDDPDDIFKFRFPLGTFLGSKEYLVLPAMDETGPGLRTGFALNQRGIDLPFFGERCAHRFRCFWPAGAGPLGRPSR